jgi:hypothetical protein
MVCGKGRMIVGRTFVYACLSGIVFSSAAMAKPDYAWRKTDESVALLNGDKVVWQYNHKKAEGKPYFHPLSNCDGEVLTWLRPKDHTWHRSMWFSWKKLNGLNYWEERGKEQLSDGRTEIVGVKVKTRRDHSATIKMTLSYHPPEKPEILSEKRTIAVSKPDESGVYCIDWESVFTASGGADVKIDRTPIGGQPGGRGWGGYAGLSIRMAEATRGWAFLNSDGNQGKGGIHGKSALWVHASGKTPSGKNAGLTMMDHPANMRHPSLWYLEPGMPYFSPAIIFKEPYTLKKGESFTLKYRVLVRSGVVDKAALDVEWKTFSKK